MNDTKILVWDLPTRLFHWLLVASIGGAFLTAESERWRDVHVLLGYGAGGLIAFRLLWGVVGSRYARFRSFLFAPGEVIAYVRSLATRSPRHYLGHNPLGSLAVFALLGLTLAAVLSGHATLNERGGEWVEELHEAVAFAILALVGAHVVGVLASSALHGENLIGSMITGRKRGAPEQAIGRPRSLVAALLVSALAALWVWYPGGGATDAAPPAQAARADDGGE